MPPPSGNPHRRRRHRKQRNAVRHHTSIRLRSLLKPQWRVFVSIPGVVVYHPTRCARQKVFPPSLPIPAIAYKHPATARTVHVPSWIYHDEPSPDFLSCLYPPKTSGKVPVDGSRKMLPGPATARHQPLAVALLQEYSPVPPGCKLPEAAHPPEYPAIGQKDFGQ